MKKPSWDRRPFGTVELIALVALVVLAMMTVWPILERRMSPIAEVQALVRLQPTKPFLNPPAAAVAERRLSTDELMLIARGSLFSPEALDSMRQRLALDAPQGSPDRAELARWIHHRLRIEPIKDTFLVYYSCLAVDPVRDFEILKAVVSASVEQIRQTHHVGIEIEATVVDPPQSPRVMPLSRPHRYVSIASFLLLAWAVSFAIVKVAQIRDSRPRYAV